MTLRLIVGGFGKSALVADARTDRAEALRRETKLAACVDYVRWQAARHPGDRLLVVTHKVCKDRFRGLPGVAVAHFNAIAGLDRFRDVRAVIVVGRPLPPDDEVARLTGAVFGVEARGGYCRDRRGVRMRDGTSRGVRVIAHEDAAAEDICAAICDDEVLQAIGRGRGVNRGAADPLEVHLLADVALPLVHDAVLSWETEAPDLMQRMLLGGVAVDSPADAAVLHPELFANEKQAQKAFERSAFKRQTPIRDFYRGMSLKSAAYRRGGRGRGWQRAWWIAARDFDASAWLEDRLGPPADWAPD